MSHFKPVLPPNYKPLRAKKKKRMRREANQIKLQPNGRDFAWRMRSTSFWPRFARCQLTPVRLRIPSGVNATSITLLVLGIAVITIAVFTIALLVIVFLP